MIQTSETTEEFEIEKEKTLHPTQLSCFRVFKVAKADTESTLQVLIFILLCVCVF